jgi:hypothetical protein
VCATLGDASADHGIERRAKWTQRRLVATGEREVDQPVVVAVGDAEVAGEHGIGSVLFGDPADRSCS